MITTPAERERLIAELRDLATVAVGLGVLGVQRAQVCRRSAFRRLQPVLDGLRRAGSCG